MKKLTLSALTTLAISSSTFGAIVLDFTNVTSVTNFIGAANSAVAETDLLLFEDVAPGHDLLITTTTSYTAANSSVNGLTGSGVFGQLNLGINQTAGFRFSILDANTYATTKTLSTVDEIAFSFLDIDSEDPQTDDTSYESVSVTQASTLFRDVSTALSLNITGGGTTALVSNTVEDEITNPTSTTLTAAQSSIAATFVFVDTNQFEFVYSTGTTSFGGRNVFFGGDVTFDDPGGGTVVPEPSAYGLLLGLVAMTTMLIRRKR